MNTLFCILQNRIIYYIVLLKSKYGLPKVTKENSKSYQTVVSEF